MEHATVRADSVAAVDVRVDPRQRAHQLRAVHERWTAGGTSADGLRTAIVRAWTRNPPRAASPTPVPLSAADLQERRERATTLAQVLPILNTVVLDVAGEAGNELVVCDSDGVVLWLDGPREIRRSSERLGFVEGAVWSEQRVGTNGLGTALTDRRPIQVFGAEHSDAGHHDWVCTGAPVLDPATGAPVGAITLSGPLRSAHPNTVALVCGAARMAEQYLGQQHRSGLERLRALPAARGVHVDVDEHGWVARADGLQVGERLWVPGGLRTGAVWAPSAGVLECERIDGGWRLRPRRDVLPQLTLTLGRESVLAVRLDGVDERIVLGPRHAAIVAALAAAPAGLSQPALARAVYDEPVSAVTVRAELSRLRARIGPLVHSRPYRLLAPCAVHRA